MWDSGNSFFNGPFEPWHHETSTFDLEVIGQIPRELNGALYRGSANQHVRPPKPERHHQFEGNGMIYAVFLRDGQAHCTNRWVRTASFDAEAEAGRGLYGSIMNGGTVPDPSIDPPGKNGANTNVMLIDDRLLVFQEIDLPHQLHPTSLETFGQYDFHGQVTGAVTAHWKIDPRNDDLLFYGLNGQIVNYYRADKHGKVLDRYEFDMGHIGVQHDFIATEDYAVWQVSPMVTNVKNIAEGKPCWIWDPSVSGSRFAVLNRHTGAVRWFEAEGNFITTHFYNGYQDGDRIIIDGHRAEGWGWNPQADFDTQRQDFNWWFKDITAVACRWELDLRTGRVTERQTTDVRGEFPRINDEYMLRKHRYGYFSTIQGDDYSITDGLAKYDYDTDKTQLIAAGDLIVPSEPVFVARESAIGEDDGWLLSLWWNPQTRLNELLIHDALNFDAEPVARVKLNKRVPPGFHGNWVGGDAIETALAADAI